MQRDRGPVILRRIRTIPLFVLATALLTAALPLLLTVGVVVDALRWVRRRTPFMSVRIVLFGWIFLMAGLGGLVGFFLSWILTLGGRRREAFLRQAYTLQSWWVAVVLGSARWLFALRFEVEGAEAPHPGPILVLARHASIVDNLLPAWFVVRPHGITLRYVLKKELLSDPVLDVGGSRLPNYFVDRRSTSPRAELRGITELATNLPPDEGVLIFPEGTRFTEARRQAAIDRISEPEDRARAEGLLHVLPPRPGGTLTLLAAAPEADVIVFAHRGLEGLAKVKDVWGGAMNRRTVHVKMWRVPAADLPTDRHGRKEWLFQAWEDIDAWIAERVRQEGMA